MHLTPIMVDVLLALRRKGFVHSGRNGFSATTLLALKRRGLVDIAKVHTWETDWKFTDAGRDCAAKIGATAAGLTDNGVHIHDGACAPGCDGKGSYVLS